ncbi:hypothetical protein KIN20_024816, partial [Parelaphostrongylus tenuis]
TFGKPSYSSSMLLAAVSSRKPTNDLKISQFMLGAKSGDSQCLDNCNLINAFQCLSSQVATLQNTQLPTEKLELNVNQTSRFSDAIRAEAQTERVDPLTWSGYLQLHLLFIQL